MQQIISFVLLCGVLNITANPLAAIRSYKNTKNAEETSLQTRTSRDVTERQILDLNRRVNDLTILADTNDSIIHTQFNNPRNPLTEMTELHDPAITLAMRAIIRPEHLQAVRDDMPAGINGRMAYLQEQQFDEAGHLLASALGGPAHLFNFVPQSPIVNRNIRGRNPVETGWYRAELQIGDFLRDNPGSSVMWTLLVNYNLPSRRPIGFELAFILYDRNGVNRGGNYFNVINYTPDYLPPGFNNGRPTTTTTTTQSPPGTGYVSPWTQPQCYIFGFLSMALCHLTSNIPY